jgi:hypothetical protein
MSWQTAFLRLLMSGRVWVKTWYFKYPHKKKCNSSGHCECYAGHSPSRHGQCTWEMAAMPWLSWRTSPRPTFPKLFSSGDHFYQSECSTDHPTLVPFESKLFKILNYSVWYAIHVNFIFCVFFGLMFNLRGPQRQNPRTTCGPRTTVWETLS